MSRLLQKLAPVARAAAQRRALPAMPKRTLFQMDNQVVKGEYSEYVHARDMLLGVAGCAAIISYAAYVVAGEPEHEAAHPHYAAPYAHSKRGPDTGAGWWPGRHCQFFEWNCFAIAYKEADEMLKELENEKLA